MFATHRTKKYHTKMHRRCVQRCDCITRSLVVSVTAALFLCSASKTVWEIEKFSTFLIIRRTPFEKEPSCSSCSRKIISHVTTSATEINQKLPLKVLQLLLKSLAKSGTLANIHEAKFAANRSDRRKQKNFFFQILNVTTVSTFLREL